MNAKGHLGLQCQWSRVSEEQVCWLTCKHSRTFETVARARCGIGAVCPDGKGISGGYGSFVLKQRNTRRYELSLPVLFSWSDGSGNVQKQGGFTRDISTNGLYVVGDVSPPVGALLTVEVLLPQAYQPKSNSARLIAAMRVSRVYEAKDVRGFAAVGDFNQANIIPNTENL